MKTIRLASLHTLTLLLVLILSPVSVSFAQTTDKVVAVVNGREIRQREVDESLMSQVMPLEQQLYALRKAALENLVTTALLEAEAKKRGVSLEELRRILTSGQVSVELVEVENAYAENISAFAAMSPDEVKERLRLDLETQKRIAQYKKTIDELREKAVIEVNLQEPRWPWLFATESSPALGRNGSAITIIEFADFQCPYCREAQRVLKQVLKTYELEVRLVFKHLPLDIHSQAFNAARAAFCAGKQGHFWEYQDALFASSDLEANTLQKTASALKLDLPKFETCLTSEDSRDAVTKDKREAARWGINGTPTFLINGKMIQGAIDFDGFKSLIEQELRSVHTRSLSNVSGLPEVRREK
jgi:predicted DsbA family dithiol-disulfide isomerase